MGISLTKPKKQNQPAAGKERLTNGLDSYLLEDL